MTTTNDRRQGMLRRLALLCAAMVLVVTSASAWLRQSKAGLGCADWPACYGQELRRLQQGLAAPAPRQATLAAVRLAHRVTALAALLLIVTMGLVCFESRPRLVPEGRLALVLLGLALGLAVLGAWSASARVPAVAIGNLLGGFAMLALSVRLAWPQATLPALRGWVRAGAALLVLQIALGGLTSASFAGLSCTGADGCNLVQALHDGDWRSLDPWREPVVAATPPFNPAGAFVQALHRVAALGVALLLAGLGVAALRRGRRAAGTLVLVLLAAQLGSGLGLAALGLPPVLALLHNLLGAALLATLVALA